MALSAGAEARRLERERVLSLLYEAEMKSQTEAEILEALPVPADDFVRETVLAVGSRKADLDELIDAHTIGWDVNRLASIDLNILRIGAYELTESPNLSTAVINNEAVELAKRFSSEEAGGFINGILDAIAKDVRAA